MEETKILLASASTFATVIGVATAIATFLLQILKIPYYSVILYITIYILLMVLFILWVERREK